MNEHVLVFDYSDLRSFVDVFKCPVKFSYNNILFDSFYDFMKYNHFDFLTKKIFAVNFDIVSNDFFFYIKIEVFIFNNVNFLKGGE